MKLQVIIDSQLAHFIPDERLPGELVLYSEDRRINLKKFNVFVYPMRAPLSCEGSDAKYIEDQLVDAAHVEKKLRDEIQDLRKLNSDTSRVFDFSKRVGGVDKLEELVSSWESQQKAISENNETKSSEKSVLINQLLDNLRKNKK